jgi:DNA-binding protein YbaB
MQAMQKINFKDHTLTEEDNERLESLAAPATIDVVRNVDTGSVSVVGRDDAGKVVVRAFSGTLSGILLKG